ncbi:MAG: HAD family hydrolase [Sarcina sp.]
MEDIKGIIFFDVDGTLIDCRKGIEEPSAKTKEAISRLKENGYLTILATGRPMSFLGEPLLGLGLDGYITSNGTYIELDSKEMFNDAIKSEVMNAIIDHLNNEQIDYLLEGQAKSYINSFETEGSKKVLSGFALPIENITDKWTKDEISISKIVIIDNETQAFKDFMIKYGNDFVFMQHPGQTSYDMYRKGCTKAYGIQHLIDELNIPKEKTYAFGDGENDIEMFELVEYGIAMGDSHQELLKHAYAKTDNVANEGIYNALVKMELI